MRSQANAIFGAWCYPISTSLLDVDHFQGDTRSDVSLHCFFFFAFYAFLHFLLVVAMIEPAYYGRRSVFAEIFPGE